MHMDQELYDAIMKRMPPNFNRLEWPVRRQLIHRAKLDIMRERKEKIASVMDVPIAQKGNVDAVQKDSARNIQRVISSGLDGDHKYIFVSFFTVDTGYEKEVQNLVSSLDSLALPYYIEGIESLGNWIVNTQYKPILIRRALDMFRRSVVCIDADAMVRRNPVLFDTLNADFAAYVANSMRRIDAEMFPDTHGKAAIDMLLSGTIWFNDTPQARALLEMWRKRCIAEPGVIDQTLLLECLKKMMGEISFYPLPLSYCKVFDYDAQREGCKEPVIEHYQASRRLKNHQWHKDGAKKTIAMLVPTRKRPEGIKRLVESACGKAMHPGRVIFYLLVSQRDARTLDMVEKLRNTGHKVIVIDEPKDKAVPVNLSVLWNCLYAVASSGDGHCCYGFFGDDVEFRTNNWDGMVVEEFRRREGKPWMIRVNESGNNPRKNATLFFTNGKLHSVSGLYMPEQYIQTYMDTWWDELCQGAGCYSFLEHVVAYHHSIVLQRAPVDENYIEKLPTREAVITVDHELFHSLAEVQLRKDMIEKLKASMK